MATARSIEHPTEYPERPYIGVGVVVWRGEEVLLIKRGKPPKAGSWSLPGGRQLLGETVRETAVREVREEADIEVRVTHLLDVVDSLTRDAENRLQFHYTLIDFVAEWESGDISAGDDAAEVRWVHPRDLDGYGLWSETLRVISLAADKR